MLELHQSNDFLFSLILFFFFFFLKILFNFTEQIQIEWNFISNELSNQVVFCSSLSLEKEHHKRLYSFARRILLNLSFPIISSNLTDINSLIDLPAEWGRCFSKIHFIKCFLLSLGGTWERQMHSRLSQSFSLNYIRCNLLFALLLVTMDSRILLSFLYLFFVQTIRRKKIAVRRWSEDD